ncbi:hypothetical protein CA54_00510 [Symmachiella macrocystis]|uniref:Uncharacterized protein n=1 Tax=Symmachiella macrocystis TaxID=2527985 RepID=A0A5C6BHS6_9PLAN|nr:hypothetical protein CA54_00510 [Symmachiella macrocystis]
MRSSTSCGVFLLAPLNVLRPPTGKSASADGCVFRQCRLFRLPSRSTKVLIASGHRKPFSVGKSQRRQEKQGRFSFRLYGTIAQSYASTYWLTRARCKCLGALCCHRFGRKIRVSLNVSTAHSASPYRIARRVLSVLKWTVVASLLTLGVVSIAEYFRDADRLQQVADRPKFFSALHK